MIILNIDGVILGRTGEYKKGDRSKLENHYR